MQTEQEYITREIESYYSTITAVEKAPMADRRDAQTDWFDALHDPALIADRIEWLLAGHYGKGAWTKAHQIIAMNKRANKVAGLSVMIAALEWCCPNRFAVEAWKRLSESEKEALRAAIQEVIDNIGKEAL